MIRPPGLPDRDARTPDSVARAGFLAMTTEKYINYHAGNQMTLRPWTVTSPAPKPEERPMPTPTISEATAACQPSLENLRAHLNSIITDQRKELEALRSLEERLAASLYGPRPVAATESKPSPEYGLQEAVGLVSKMLDERSEIIRNMLNMVGVGS